MAMKKVRELRALLRDLGFVSRSGRGSHEVWVDPQAPRRRVVLCGRDGDDAQKYQAAQVRAFKRGSMVYSSASGQPR
jgi:predicted RNA binding protein YcfA (HicA-like mRNA interferase family)